MQKRRKAAVSDRPRAAGFVFACGLFFSASVPALATEDLDSERPEAWAMFYFTSVTLFSGLGTPKSRELGEVEAGVEVGNIPQLNEEQRTVGFDGTKKEDLNNSPIFARGRLTVGLPWKLGLLLGYTPPVTVWGVKPHIFSYGLERPVYERGPWTVGLRAYGQVGSVEGAFTCPGDAASEPPGSPGNPYGCEGKSKDQITVNYWGLEASGSYRSDSFRGLTPWVTLAGNYLDTRFQVKADTFGFRDRERLKADTGTVTLGIGLRYPVTEKIDLSVGMSFTPLWVTRPPSTSDDTDPLLNARSVLSYRFR